MSIDARRGIILVTGAQAAGKSTVGRLLAERFDRGAFIEGDVMWKLVVSGRVDMSPEPSEEALRQFDLRITNGALLAGSLFDAGFTAVHAEIVMEHGLPRYVGKVHGRPLFIVMLRPSPEVIAERERGRGSSAYRDWPSVAEGVAAFYEAIEATPKLGLWVDSSDQSPEETVDEIIDRVWDEGRVG